MKYYIITADDYGMCDVVNKAIDDCMSAGLVTTTNVIVNMDDLASAANLRKRFPNVSIGMHWNITAGKPISPIHEISSLVDENGNFYKVLDFFYRYKKGLIKKEHIKKELKAQYKLFYDLCGKADYWNTHQNSGLSIHTFSIFNEVALELGIDKTRSFQRTYIKGGTYPSTIKGKFIELAKRIFFDLWFGYIIPKTGTKLPDGRMIYFDDTEKSKDIRNIAENVLWKKKNIVEMVVHPAIVANYKYFGTLKDVRLAEWKMFSDPDTLKYLNERNINVANFDILDDNEN